MSHFEFSIPLKRDELLETQDGQYHVQDIVLPRMLLSKIQDAGRAYYNEGVEYILEHFDTYFSIIVHGTELEWNIINKGFEHIMRNIKSLCSHLEPIVENQTNESDVRIKNLNILQMVMYLFIEIMKTKDAKLAAENSAKLTLGRKGKKKTVEDEFCGWRDADKLEALISLHSILQQPLSKLWDPPLAEENFVIMVANPCYKALEEQIIKKITARETVFQILGVLIKKYNHGQSCLIKLVQILQMVEHAVSPICAGVVQLTKDFDLSNFGPQMVLEIAETLSSSEEDYAGTVQGAAKNCGAFLQELTKELPKEMANAIETIQPYLEIDESYTLRIGVLGMMCEVLSVELRGEELSHEERTRRDDFLDYLYDHIHDLSAYVRHKVLQFWGRLQRENCVPLIRQRALLKRATGRLRDRSAIVRKAAIQLLKIFLEFNPFAAELNLELLEEQLASEQLILEELNKKANPSPDPVLVKKWEKIEEDVIKVIKEQIHTLTQDEYDLSQASLDSLYESIRKSLSEKNYYKAYLIIKHTERLYPDAKILRCQMEKSDQVEYFVALMRNVYVHAVVREQGQSIAEQCENELAIYKRIEEKENLVAFLEDSVFFCRIISEAVPLINSLLMSKQAGDVHEAIDFFTIAHHFKIESAKVGVTNMLLLVWSPDQDKREAVTRAYRDMYLVVPGRTERARQYRVARRLVALLQTVDRGASLALEHLTDKWCASGDITPNLIQIFWELFLKKIDETTDMDSYAAMSFLVMIAKAKPSLALANMEIIQTQGLAGDYNSRNLSAQMLLSIAKNNLRYPADHAVFTSLYDSLMETFSTMSQFASFAGNAIDLIYAVCDTPEAIITKILSEMYARVQAAMVKDLDNGKEVTIPTELLTRFIFVLGHIALQQLIYLDIYVYSELRRRNQVREERKAEKILKTEEKRKAEKIRKNEEKRKKNLSALKTPARRGRPEDLRRQKLSSFSASSASSRANRSSVLSNKDTLTHTTTEEEIELEDVVGGDMEADDADAEYVRDVCERCVVGGDTPLTRYLPLLRWLLTRPAGVAPALSAAAALTYSRFMLVSSSVCEDGLQLMMTVLNRSKNVALRTNLTAAFADLTLRFPNLTQPWTQHMYCILRDPALEVRRCAVKVLSFLVLHEMVRVKGQIADMALCCADEDARVASMTRLFFRQLACKGNALYNVMPDIISRLSNPELGVPEDRFKIIMKYITSLIQKDRQMEALVEKLCQRLMESTEERQWRDLAYCLSLFTYNERSLRKLIKNIDSFKDKLHCNGVMECFSILMKNTSKLARNEIKALVTKLGEKIEECFAVRDSDDTEKNQELAAQTTVRKSGTAHCRPAPRVQPPRQRRSSLRSSSWIDENEFPNKFVSRIVRKPIRNVVKIHKDGDSASDVSDYELPKKQNETSKRKRKYK